MRRYIDAEALLQRLPDDLPYKASVKRVLMQATEADVAPKGEVAKDIFAEIEDVINNIGYFDEIDFEALKKKYTEVQQ